MSEHGYAKIGRLNVCGDSASNTLKSAVRRRLKRLASKKRRQMLKRELAG